MSKQDEDTEISDTLKKEYSKLTYDELIFTRKSAIFARRLFNYTGVATILVILIWPGMFTIPIGLFAVYYLALSSISGDIILNAVDKYLTKAK